MYLCHQIRIIYNGYSTFAVHINSVLPIASLFFANNAKSSSRSCTPTKRLEWSTVYILVRRKFYFQLQQLRVVYPNSHTHPPAIKPAEPRRSLPGCSLGAPRARARKCNSCKYRSSKFALRARRCFSFCARYCSSARRGAV